MCTNKVLIVVILVLMICHSNNTERFSSQSEITSKAKEIYEKKHLFTPDVAYSGIKSKLKWVDPVVFNDIYKLSLKEKLSISNLENTLYNSIT
jgi:hypothetical protein